MKKIICSIVFIMMLFMCTVYAEENITITSEGENQYRINLTSDTSASGAVLFVYSPLKGNYDTELSFNPEGEFKKYFIQYSRYQAAENGSVNFNVIFQIPQSILSRKIFVSVLETDGTMHNYNTTDMPGLLSLSKIEFADEDGALLGDSISLDPGDVYKFNELVSDKYGNKFDTDELTYAIKGNDIGSIELEGNRLTIDYKSNNVNKTFDIEASFGDVKKSITVNVSDKYTSSTDSSSGTSSGTSSKKSVGTGSGISVPTSMVSPTVETACPFKDLQASAWYYDDLIELHSKGFLNGDNGYAYPDSNISVQEICALIVRTLKLSDSDEKSSIVKNDSTVSDWAVADVAAALSNNIITGNGNSLNGVSYATREQAFVMLSRAFNITGITEESKFADSDTVSDWAKTPLNIMADVGYVKGDNDGNVLPLNNITRAEFSAVLLRIINDK